MDEKLPVIPDTADISDQTPEESAKIIESLPPARQKKVHWTKDRLRRSEYCASNKFFDDKTVDGLLEDIKSSSLKI